MVGLEDGSQARARAVVIAAGVSYRRLGVPELEALAGAGVFYGAGTIEAQAVTGKPAFVVGGGNSAGQAALHLSKYAQQVTILIRSQSLAASMSDYLIRQIDAAPNVDVRYRCEVAGGGGSGHLEQLLLRDRDTGQTERVPAAGLFILIGGSRASAPGPRSRSVTNQPEYPACAGACVQPLPVAMSLGVRGHADVRARAACLLRGPCAACLDDRGHAGIVRRASTPPGWGIVGRSRYPRQAGGQRPARRRG